MITPPAHVLVVGAGLHVPRVLHHLRRLVPEVRTSLMAPLSLLPKIHDAADHEGVVGLSDDVPPERWADHARAFDATARVDRILCLDDDFAMLAANVAEALQVQWHSPSTVQWVSDKIAYRHRLAAVGVEDVAHAEVAAPCEVASFGNRIGWPLILKPVSGTGSVGISVISGPGDVPSSWDRVVGAGHSRFVVEAMLVGDQFSLDAVSVSGEHHVLPIVRKFSEARGMVEVAHLVPAPLSEEDVRTCVQHVRRILGAVGVVDGPSSTEFVLTAAGPRAIETHVRPSGGEIPTLVDHAVGYDVYEAVARAVVGDTPASGFVASPTRWAALWHAFPDVDGVVHDVMGVDAARAAPGVVEVEVFAEVGDPAARLNDNGERLAVVMAVADSPTSAVECARSAAESIGFLVALRGLAGDVR